MDNENVILQKSKDFAVRIIKLYNFLREEKKEFVLSKQIVRSGTSIGANVREAIRGFSKADFSFKMNIALKESNETEYWLELLYETGFIRENEFRSIYNDCCELSRILTAIVKSSRDLE
jgi:four helix bundle protein